MPPHLMTAAVPLLLVLGLILFRALLTPMLRGLVWALAALSRGPSERDGTDPLAHA